MDGYFRNKLQTSRKDTVVLSCLVPVIRMVQGIYIMHPIKIPRSKLPTISVRRSLTSWPDCCPSVLSETRAHFSPLPRSLLPDCGPHCDGIIIGGPPASLHGSVLSCLMRWTPEWQSVTWCAGCYGDKTPTLLKVKKFSAFAGAGPGSKGWSAFYLNDSSTCSVWLRLCVCAHVCVHMCVWANTVCLHRGSQSCNLSTCL